MKTVFLVSQEFIYILKRLQKRTKVKSIDYFCIEEIRIKEYNSLVNPLTQNRQKPLHMEIWNYIFKISTNVEFSHIMSPVLRVSKGGFLCAFSEPQEPKKLKKLKKIIENSAPRNAIHMKLRIPNFHFLKLCN